MRSRERSDIIDFIKIAVLLILTGCVMIDIFVVRRSEKSLKASIAAHIAEFEAKAKENESERIAAEADFRRRLKEAEQKVLAERAEIDKIREEKRLMEESYEKKLEESEENYRKETEKLSASFESQIQALAARQDSISSRRQALQHVSKDPVKDVSISQLMDDRRRDDTSKKVVRCDRCLGKGEIQRKMTCDHCGGSGRIKETYVLSKTRNLGYGWNYSNGQKLSTVYQDCPHCLPGAFKGGGSKGYTIMTITCPKCDGKGKMEQN